MNEADHPLRVLFVEDNEDDFLLLHAMLEEAGHQVRGERVVTRSQLEAALKRAQWDLVISDYDLKEPDFDGLAALKLVQGQGLDMPFILVSGRVSDSEAVAAMKAGAHDYLVKDVRMPRLGPAIDRELREAAIRLDRRRAEKLLAAEHSITRLLAEAHSVAEAVPRILQILNEGLDMELGAWWALSEEDQSLKPGSFEMRIQSDLLQSFVDQSRSLSFSAGQSLPGSSWTESRPIWLADLSDSPFFHRPEEATRAGLLSAVAVPVRAQRSFFGVLEFFSQRRLEPDGRLLNMLSAIAGEIAQFAQRRLAEEALRRAHDELEIRVQQRTVQLRNAIAERERLEHELLDITEKERRRIALDLHDDLGQKLSGIALMTKALQQRLGRQRLPEARDAGRIHDHVQQAVGLASGVAHDLAAMDLKETSLTAALAQLAAHAKRFYGISCSFNADAATPALQPPAVKQLSKIAQEAITNAIKHGKANRIALALETNDGKLTLSIRNNISDSGKPFPDLHGPQTGMGLRIMNYRASLIGGSFQVRAAGPKTTLVTCTVPVPEKEAR